MIDIWRKTLIGLGAVTVLTGLEFAFFQDFVGVRWLTDPVADQVLPEGAKSSSARLASLYLGLVGAVTVYMGVMTVAIAAGPLKRRDPWTLPALGAGLIAWYGVDTAVALSYGATALVIFNTLVFAAFSVPIAGIWLEGRSRRRAAA